MKASETTSILKIASVFIGTVIGAGFASGQELVKFFTSYGDKGIYGLILAGILFAVVGWHTLYIAYEGKHQGYKPFMEALMGKTLSKIMEAVVTLFMLACFCAMLAGCGALLQQRFNTPYMFGVLLMAMMCYITFLFDVKGVILINSILVPILFIGAFVLGINALLFRDTAVFSHGIDGLFNELTGNWVSAAILYVSYNMITSIVILTSLGHLIKNERVAKWGGIIGGAALGLLGLCLGVATLINYGKIIDVEIPLLEIVMQYTPAIQYMYIIVLLAAMFTTAVANGYGLLSRVTIQSKIGRQLFNLIMIIVAILIARMGFSNLVKKVYPIFGYLGMFEMIMIILYFVQLKLRTKSRRKYR
ncbi:YkvI family membrane protein [Vallitalea okinawensis]|uniref:YkvI family membrane protein n=1 Tax=Vallitalea okinawensis TaxID=2078660 RepID=UPI000CFE2C0F|nr:hypothetical protein [Vallitalea okinawensis]